MPAAADQRPLRVCHQLLWPRRPVAGSDPLGKVGGAANTQAPGSALVVEVRQQQEFPRQELKHEHAKGEDVDFLIVRLAPVDLL